MLIFETYNCEVLKVLRNNISLRKSAQTIEFPVLVTKACHKPMLWVDMSFRLDLFAQITSVLVENVCPNNIGAGKSFVQTSCIILTRSVGHTWSPAP